MKNLKNNPFEGEDFDDILKKSVNEPKYKPLVRDKKNSDKVSKESFDSFFSKQEGRCRTLVNFEDDLYKYVKKICFFNDGFPVAQLISNIVRDWTEKYKKEIRRSFDNM